jgi:aldose 1-epimerase
MTEADRQTTEAGEAVQSFTLVNARGLRAELIELGATLTEMHVPDRAGRMADVVLGFDSVRGYESEANQYFGCIVGRVCNRIGGARFTLDGVEYILAANDGPNHLHGGGARALSRVVWRGEAFAEAGARGVRFHYVSPAGEEGYPGTLSLTVTYTLNDHDELHVDFVATTDAPTPVNLTNHAYWNLAGAGAETVLDHELTLAADAYTPADATLVPTGAIAPVIGTPLDFREPRPLGARIAELLSTPARGYDHNFVLAPGDSLRFAARLRHPGSGRTLELWTTEPGLQVYTGNFLFGQIGKRGRSYPRRSAVCLEAQHFPDSVHRGAFPSIILRPGEVYRQKTVHRFLVR